jgi:hypothetical protein
MQCPHALGVVYDGDDQQTCFNSFSGVISVSKLSFKLARLADAVIPEQASAIKAMPQTV